MVQRPPQTAAPDAYPPIGDYALIGDMHSAALVSRDGSIDWYCAPRFDSPPIFARLLDWSRGGHYRIAPAGVSECSRRYVESTNILESTYRTAEGVVRITDFMPVDPTSRPGEPHDVFTRRHIVRIAECLEGAVDLEIECQPRFGWNFESPRFSLASERLAHADGGEGDVFLYAPVPLQADRESFDGHARLREGDRVCAALIHAPDEQLPGEISDEQLLSELRETREFWERWSSACTYDGPYRDLVLRSAITLKSLSYSPTGALLAAATTSLPEEIGGSRNWDYRFTWLRDASMAVSALAPVGFTSEALYFKEWLERTAVRDRQPLQVVYGPAGEHDLTEVTIDGVEGYRGSRPVRVGNEAHRQFQLDIYGDIQHAARAVQALSRQMDEQYWEFHRRIAELVIERWREPDAGIWEPRSERRHFTYSKAMCWEALDCAIGIARDLDLPADLERWRRVRAEIREDVLANGFDAQRGVFTQTYAGDGLDASLLMLPLIGFIEATDPRMKATILAIRDELAAGGGLIRRYTGFDDGVSGGEGAFVVSSFWLVENLNLLGRREEAVALFERICGYANDVGLLSEEIDGDTGMLLGNYPQAFSHLGLISAAVSLQRGSGTRAQGEESLARPALTTH